MILLACFRLYSRSSLVLSSILPQPAKGTTTAVALSSPQAPPKRLECVLRQSSGRATPLHGPQFRHQKKSHPTQTQRRPSIFLNVDLDWSNLGQDSHLQEVSTEPRVLELSQIFYKAEKDAISGKRKNEEWLVTRHTPVCWQVPPSICFHEVS